MAIEEPKYKVTNSDGSFEIRQYAPILIAETLVEGDMDEASSKGFRLIADFIFGNNQIADASTGEKIAMTAPVTVEPHNDYHEGKSYQRCSQQPDSHDTLTDKLK